MVELESCHAKLLNCHFLFCVLFFFHRLMDGFTISRRTSLHKILSTEKPWLRLVKGYIFYP